MARKLHIGGVERADGWEVLNVVPGPHVDHVGEARDLSRFEDGSFSAIYASHVVEHLDYMGEIQAALAEWRRALEPGGVLYVSVPDLEVLARLFLEKDKHDIDERLHLMRMMFGGHVDRYDVHLAGLDEQFLFFLLQQAGFANVRRVKEFGLFRDSSTILFKGVPISLNVIAEKSA